MDVGCGDEAVGTVSRPAHHGWVNRLRVLAAVFACLAALAGALNVAVAAQGTLTAARSTVGDLCSDCDDCDKSPCPMPMADCIQMHANPGPALMSAAVELGASPYIVVQWPSAFGALSGLSPPPEPQPPRT